MPAASVKGISDLDPAVYVRSAVNVSFLYQLGLEDRSFTRAQLVGLFEASGGSKDMIWYEADHDWVLEAGQAERIEWLDVRIQMMG